MDRDVLINSSHTAAPNRESDIIQLFRIISSVKVEDDLQADQ